MAAYASLLSLGHILDQLLQHPPCQKDVLYEDQIYSLRKNITFLQDFLEEFSLIREDEILALEEKISRSVYATKYIIESRVVDQILEDSEAGSESSSILFCQDLDKVIEEIASMEKDVMKIKETERIKIVQQPTKVATAGSFIRGPSYSKNTMVGFDDDLIQIMEKLTGHQFYLLIISIVGMGGIGKTTLATNVYHHPLIVEHFHIHAWVTISQQYSVHEIILALLKDDFAECRKEQGDEAITQLTDEELGGLLYRSLSGRKYLIVLDDLWSIECWNSIKRFFPDDYNGSRVMITTRLKNVADDFRSCTPHQLRFLDEDQSWDLFCGKVFGKQSCPPELEEVGKTIVRNCGALPLAIVAISLLLAKSSRTVDYWECVANDTNAALNMGGDGLCIEILSLSYKHLPVHLKPCFLYMAMFPEDHKIRISRLIKLWVAEGILKPIRSRSLEEVAKDNLRDLVDRNLIMIKELGSRNKIKTCTIHNLIRNLCLKEAQKEKIPRVAVMDYLNYHSTITGHQHRLIIQRSFDKEERQQQIFDTSSLACSELKSTSAKLHKLLRALNMDDICSHEEIVRLVNSSYIDVNALYFPNLLNTLESLSLLWNLQTITIAGTLSETPINLPAEIWEMSQLRHLKWKGEFYLPDPPSSNNKNGRRYFRGLEILQTLYKIRNFRCTDEVVGRILNLRKLGITYREFPSGFGWDYYKLYNLVHLYNLESLLFESDVNVPPSNLCFPVSLKKLTLRKCGVSWEDLTVVGSLHNLEVLNLMFGAVRGREWNPVEGQFYRLKSLRIVDTDLVEWIADSYHFPRLEKLQLVLLRHLKEIPNGIGEIPTLGSISLLFCSYSAHSSAKKIQEEQQIFGNDYFQLQHLYNARNHRLIFCNEKSATTAYASLLSLGHILDQLLQHPPRQMAVLDKAQVDSLLEKLTFLRDFLEEFSLVRGDKIQLLAEKIARSAYATEDIIERRVVDQFFENSVAERRSGIFSCLDLLKVMEEFDSMKKDVMKIKETERIKIMEQPRIDVTAGSFVRGASSSKNTMLGFDDHLNQIIETLTGDESKFQIISIVGMGGIGKTTLARNVFHDPSIVRHFDRHVWVTISQQYSVQETLSGLFKDIEVLEGGGEEITQKNVDKLGLRLHRSLFDRRYFIVMDDMWSIKVWDAIRRFFPDNNNGSRVMVTTRLSNVADNFCSCTPHQLHFLDEDQSWALFCNKVFGKESCPPEFVDVGKTIVKNCRGLPLAIVAISGLLAKSSPTVEYWEYVAKDTNEALNMGGDGLCFEILSLSYKNLPLHLKPCFLYMAIFPEDHEIRISKLIKLWVSEGILKPIRSSSLEEVAEDNLKDLIDRNLIQVHDYGSRNKIKTCTIHDLLRDLCLREGQKEKFPRVAMMDSLKYPSGIIENQRRIIIQRRSDNEECQQQVFDTSSFACGELKSTSAKLHRLLRVLNMDICSYEEIVRFVNSRYIDLDAKTFSNLLNTLEPLSVLCNLQTIIISGSLSGLPLNLLAKIWEMPQLRHIKVEDGGFDLPDPPSTNNKNGRRDVLVLKNLRTLYKIRNFRCTDEVVGGIPNLKKLGITYREFPSGFGWDYYEVYNLSHFHNLESLFLDSDENVLSKNLCFPSFLKKLTLRKCGVSWEDLNVVGSLPHLEVLNLSDHAVMGREWNPLEGQFLELKSLRIESTDLVDWIADSSHFPCLEKLELEGLEELTEIPYGIGGIDTLRSISLESCSDSANSSAKKIQEEQQNLGYPMFLSIDGARKYT